MRIWTVFLFLFIPIFLFSQTETPPLIQKLEAMPQYPGGEVAMNEFLAKHIIYPKAEKEKGISGRVIIQFVVDTIGNVTNFKVLSNTPEAFNNEVIRVMKLMPNWKPGMQNGKPVFFSYKIPVSFQLDNKSSDVAEYIGIICGIAVGILLYKLLF